jgi:type II secretory pathway component PulF
MYRDLLDDLRSLLDGGVPVVEALETIAARGSARRRALAAGLRREVTAGRTLAEALAAVSRGVPAEHAALVAAGERAGQLVEALGRLVELLDHRREVASRAFSFLLQPLVTLAAAIVFLPLPLLLTAAGSAAYGSIVFGSFSLIGLLALAVWKGPALLPGPPRRACERGLLAVPWFGSLLGECAAGRVLWLLGRLLEAGISYDEALLLAANAASLETLGEDLLEARRRIAHKESASAALASVRILRGAPDVLARLAASEKAGALDRSLQEVGRSLEEGYVARLDRFVRLLPQLIILLVGVAVISYAFVVLRRVYTLPP